MTLRDLGVFGRIYYFLVVGTGLSTILWAVQDLLLHPTINAGWLFLAGLSLLSGRAAVRLPVSHSILSFSETFLVAAALMYGPAAGVLTVALEALVISLSPKTTPHKGVFTLSANSLAMLCGASLFFWIAQLGPATAWYGPVAIHSLWLPVSVFVGTYFAISSWLVSTAVAFERKANPARVWQKSFAWLLPNYAAGGFAATVLVTYAPEADPKYLLIVLPLVGLLYHSYVTSIGRAEDANRHLAELNRLYLSTIETLAMAIDAKDQITHGHIRRVQQYAVALARRLGVDDPQQLRAIEAASLLHDMGKLAVPDYILNKPGVLTAAEFDRIKTHASVGADILSSIDFPYPVVPIVRHHHENWDGSGYPDGLKGNDIPMGARVLSVVDCFDALTSDRPYRPRLNDAAALAIIRERRGTMYEPRIVDAFQQVLTEVRLDKPDDFTFEAPLSAITGAALPPTEHPGANRLGEISASSEEMLTLYELASAVSTHLSLDEAAEIVARYLRRLVPVTHCVFFTHDETTDELVAAFSSGDVSRLFSGLRIPMGQRLTGWVAANRQTILNSDPTLDLGEPARLAQPPLRSSLSTAMVANQRLVGVMTLYSGRINAFNENHRRIAEAVARQTAGTFVSARLQTERTLTGPGDYLNGIPSIDGLSLLLASGTNMTADGTDVASVVLVTVDQMAECMKQLGRLSGNELLAKVSAFLRETLHQTELLFRSKDDGLVIFLDRTGHERALRRATGLRSTIARSGIRDPLWGTPITVSVAVACVPHDGNTIDAVLEVAQSRLTPLQGDRPHPRGSVH